MQISPPQSTVPDDVLTLGDRIDDATLSATPIGRVRVVHLARTGLSPTARAEEPGCSEQTAMAWREHYRSDGRAGLRDPPRVLYLSHSPDRISAARTIDTCVR